MLNCGVNMIESHERKVQLIETIVTFNSFKSFLTILLCLRDSSHSNVILVHLRPPPKLGALQVLSWLI